MTQLNQNVVGIDAAIFMHPLTWKASGHVDGFAGFPGERVHKNGRVDAHHVLVKLGHSPPPELLEVVFQFHAVGAVVVHGLQAIAALVAGYDPA